MNTASAPILIELPPVALYYNQWNGLENHEVRDELFEQVTINDIQNLRVGQIVWRDEDPIYHHGKVYGYVKRVVTKIEDCGDGSFIAHLNGGSSRIDDGRHCLLYLLKDPDKLNRLVAADPRIGKV